MSHSSFPLCLTMRSWVFPLLSCVGSGSSECFVRTLDISEADFLSFCSYFLFSYLSFSFSLSLFPYTHSVSLPSPFPISSYFLPPSSHYLPFSALPLPNVILFLPSLSSSLYLFRSLFNHIMSLSFSFSL